MKKLHDYKTSATTDLKVGDLVTFWVEQHGYQLGRVKRVKRDGRFYCRALHSRRSAIVTRAIKEDEPEPPSSAS